MNRVYVDHAAATPVCDAAKTAYANALQYYGNPGALHAEGVAAAEVLHQARTSVAKLLGAKPDTIRFVSGGTEANNLALLGAIRAIQKDHTDVHVITTAIEHASVLEPLRFAEKTLGVQVTYIAPNERGIIRPEALRDALTPHTRLISVGAANNETGTVQPLRALVKTVRAYEAANNTARIAVHTDAGQVHLYEPALVNTLDIDLLTIGSGKLYGPRGVGALYVRRGTPLAPIVFGGGHEEGVRSGTESVALTAGFAAACEHIQTVRKDESIRVRALQQQLQQAVEAQSGVVNAPGKHTLPHFVNVSFRGIDPEYFVAYVDARGIAVSTKSACAERANEKASHVLAAMYTGDEAWRATTGIRITMGEETTKEGIDTLIALLPEAIAASSRN